MWEFITRPNPSIFYFSIVNLLIFTFGIIISVSSFFKARKDNKFNIKLAISVFIIFVLVSVAIRLLLYYR